MKKLYISPLTKCVPLKTAHHLCSGSGGTSAGVDGETGAPSGDVNGDDEESGGPTSRQWFDSSFEW